MQFIKFLGNSALNDKQIAVYRDGDEIVIQPETTHGNPLRYQDDKGRWHTCQPLRFSREKFEEFECQMYEGVIGSSDARVVHRALAAVGYPV